MSYFVADIKKIYKNKLISIMLIFMLIVMILDPISVYFVNRENMNFFDKIGANPFQFWLLMNSVSWGHTIYFTLLWAFPVISTGLIFFDERSSSVYHILVSKKNRMSYVISKLSATFCATFINFLVLLMINLLVTYLSFSPNAPRTEYYDSIIPNIGTFADYFYQIDPLYMAVIYSMLNAFVIAILSVLVLNIHMMFRFKNKYLAFLIPFMLLYMIDYGLTLLLNDKLNYNLGIIIQPRASNALTNCITSYNVITVVGIVLLANLLITIVNLIRDKEII